MFGALGSTIHCYSKRRLLLERGIVRIEFRAELRISGRLGSRAAPNAPWSNYAYVVVICETCSRSTVDCKRYDACTSSRTSPKYST